MDGGPGVVPAGVHRYIFAGVERERKKEKRIDDEAKGQAVARRASSPVHLYTGEQPQR